MFVNAAYMFVGGRGVKDKIYCIVLTSSLYIKARNSLLVELNAKYSNV